MAKAEKWKIELHVEDDLIDWMLSRQMKDGGWEKVEEGSGPVVDDVLYDAGRELELFLPEWFS